MELQKQISSFIGTAETNIEFYWNCRNIDPCRKDFYSMSLSCYKAEYNNKFPKKCKSSDVALYVNDKYTYTRLEPLCHCTANIECLFIKVTNFDKPYTIGVVYKPPDGSEITGLTEIDNIMQILCIK